MLFRHRLFLVLSALALLACSLAAQAADTFEVDGAHSSVVYKISHLGFSNNYGMFKKMSGTFVLDSANLAGSSVDITIDAASIDSGNAKRDEHLKSPDFFNVAQFPTITFKSSKIEKGSGADNYKVTGALTLHGVTKNVIIDVHHNKTGEGMQGETRSGFDANFKIKRSDFGMGFMTPNLGDDVSVWTSFEGVKK
jgi:polyisoprenoid-binding protein YceI